MRTIRATIALTRQAFRICRDFCSNPLRIEQALTVLKACAVIGAFAYSVYLLHIYVYSTHIAQPPLSLAAAFLTAQAAAIASQLGASCLVKKLAEMNSRWAAEREPLIRAALAAHAVGEDRLALLRPQWLRSPRTFERCLKGLLTAVSGESQRRLTKLAAELGILEYWSRRARSRDAERRALAAECFALVAPEAGAEKLRKMLDDPSPHVRGVAFRSVLKTADAEELAGLLHRTAELPHLVRVFVAGELRHRNLALDPETLSERIGAENSSALLALLKLVEAWGRPLPPESMGMLVEHRDPQARSVAVRLAPVSAPRPAAEQWALDALRSDDDSVRRAGLAAAAQLRLTPALPLIEQCAGSPNADLAALACMALAQVGPAGRNALEDMIATGEERRAAFAAQALAGAALSRPFQEVR